MMTQISLSFPEKDIEHLAKVGIYSIHHTARPDRLYIGSTASYKTHRPSHRGFYKRFYDHYRVLSLNTHHSKFLQNTVNKHGLEGLVFSILEICDNCSVKEIRIKEQEWIDKLKPVYNGSDRVYPKGRVWSPEECQKQSLKMQGKALPEEVYNKLRRPVYQYDKALHFIQRFDSIGKASNYTGIDAGSINKCAHGKRGTAGNYIWSLTKLHPIEAKQLGFSENRLTNSDL